jgi:lysophospholipase L1-like esterase
VNYQAPVAVNGTPPVTTTCAPASGTQFAVGSTLVTCTATDAAGRAGDCSFTVRIALAPRLQKTSFMAFGASMTEGVIALRAPMFALAPSPTSYPGQLEVLLRNRYASQSIVMDDEGLGGERAVTGLERLEGLLRTSRPEVVLLLEGANDLNDKGDTGAAQAASAMEQMVVATLDAGAVPFLATLPPQREGGARAYHPEAVRPYNERLVAIAAFRGATLVDLYAAFGGNPSPDLIGPDGLHPTEAGYTKMADAFFAAIRTKLEVPAPAPVTAFGR